MLWVFSAPRRLGVSFCIFLALSFTCQADASTPTYAEVRAAYRPSEAWLLDRQGEVIGSRRVEGKVRRLEWVALSDLSPAMTAALLAAEDRRFFDHGGVDWPGMAAVALDNIRRALQGRRPRGGSTLTMQLAAFLEPALRNDRGRSLLQKWDQAGAARDIEARWSKPQILEAYLNLAPFRGELVGIHAAARGLFGKHPSGLDSTESLLLAALLRGPAAAPGAVARRACAVAASLPQAPACRDLDDKALASLSGRPDPMAADSLAPHLAARYLKEAGSRVRTTLDGALQREAVASLRRHLAELAGRHVADGAVVVLDNRTGEVLAWVGSSGELSAASQVDGVLAPRQAGSTLKPFLYGLALEKGILTAASLLDDAPLQISTPGGLYVPQNYERDFKGPVSVRTALASSLNVPAVQTLVLVGLEPFAARLRALGLDTLTEAGDFYGPGLALGAADVRLLQLANAYRTLANGGLAGPVKVLAGLPPLQGEGRGGDGGRGQARTDASPNPPPGLPLEGGGTSTAMGSARYGRLMPAPVAFILGDILSDRGARALTFGLENPLVTRRWAAVKTGTSKDMRDNWCIGWSPRFTVGVWVGNFDGSPMQDVSGVTGAAPVWRDLMLALERTPAEAPRPPPGLVRRSVRFVPALEAARQEWFVAGTETGEVALADGVPRILAPADGSIIALDPDIPRESQQLRFESRGAGLWQLDGRALGADAGLWWSPTPGHHRLSLLDPAGRELDAVEFQVRGQ